MEKQQKLWHQLLVQTVEQPSQQSPRIVCSLLATMGKVENTINITWNANPGQLISHCF